ncbi:MAG: Ig-like domain-containing protein [Fibrobacteria bacterium]
MSPLDRSSRKFASFARLLKPLGLASILLLLSAGCYFDNEEKVENTLSFDRIADSLIQFDEVSIVLKELNGDTLEVLYRGKVRTAADIHKLKASRWDGGQITVSITGTKAGVKVYQVDTRMNAQSNARETQVVVSPYASLSSLPPSLSLLVGDSLALPVIAVSPADLVNKNLQWSAAPEGLLDLGLGFLKARQAGSGQLMVRLQANPNVTLTIPVTVSASGPAPESISILPESLQVAAGGMPGAFTVAAAPLGSSAAVAWSSADTLIATVDASGRVQGRRQGQTRITAASLLRPSVSAMASVTVGAVLVVEKVAFSKDSLNLLLGAAAESLLVSVLPEGANPAVTFTLSDPAKASIQNGRITGKAEGRIIVTAASASNPAIVDELIVRIAAPVANDSTPPGKPTVTVIPAGPTQERRPTWTWKTGGGGAGAYQISLDKPTFDTAATSLSDTVFKPAVDLAGGLHVLYVRERDASGNWSAAGSAQVDIDITGPGDPKVTGTSPTSSLPRWTWTTGGDGGAGFFRFRLVDASFPANAPESRDSAYALASAVSGTTYTLFVQERDLAGNWSKPVSLAIKYDVTKPSVAITLPQPSGTFVTAADTVTLAGTVTGPNGIAKLEYAMDAGTAAPLTAGANGAWTLAALKVPNAKTTSVKVIATDNLGNTGEAVLQIMRDSDPPLPPTALLKPASPTNVAQSAWTWSAGADGASGSGLSGKYRWKLNTGTWTETNAASAPTVLLAEGPNTFSVQEQDKAGNWSEALTGTVALDTKAPAAVTFVGVDGTLTADATPTWTWTPSASNGGIGSYILKLDAGAEFDGGAATSYTPTAPLSDNATHTLTVKEKDQVPGVAGTPKSFSYKVDSDPPAAPTVKSAVPDLANSETTNNPGFTWKSGGGGNGKYIVKVNAETTPRVNGGVQTTFSLGASDKDKDGTYTIHVTEQDDLGRWGPEGTFTIKLDRTGPVFTQVRVKGSTFDLRDNYITNDASLTISYLADGSPKEFTCTLINNSSKSCTSPVNTDAANNSSTFSRTIWLRSGVIFFKPVAAGAADGSSWENARSILQITAGETANKQLWLASGDYSSQTLTLTMNGCTVLGGFNAGSFPTNDQNRTTTNTILGSVQVSGSQATIWDGVRFNRSLESYHSNATFRNCQGKNLVNIASGTTTLNNFELTGSGTGALHVAGGATVTWNGGRCTDNTDPNDMPIHIFPNGTLNLTGNLNMPGLELDFLIYFEGNLDVSTSVQYLERDDLFKGEGGRGNFKGIPL